MKPIDVGIEAYKWERDKHGYDTTAHMKLRMSPGGTKHDAGKARLDLIPFEVLEEVAKVLGYGAEKYKEEWNWYKGFNYGRLMAASLRHISAFQQGEDSDPESGLNHLAHALCCLFFLRALQMHGKGTDDRCKRKT